MIQVNTKISVPEFTRYISDLAYSCSQCGSKLTACCMEQCCANDVIFCRSCSLGDHLAHMTNDMVQILLNYITENEIMGIAERISSRLATRTRILRVDPQEAHVEEELDMLIEDLYSEKQKVLDRRQHDQMYTFVIDAFQRKLPAKDAAHVFHVMLRSLRFANRSKELLKLLKRLEKEMQMYVLHPDWVWQSQLRFLRQKLNRGLEKRIEKIVLANCFQQYSKESTLGTQDYRSIKIDYELVGQTVQFSGLRLVLEDYWFFHGPNQRFRLPHLRELHTQIQFLEYPEVAELGIYMNPHNNKSDLLRNIPLSVRRLRVTVACIPSSHSIVHGLLHNITKLNHLQLRELSIRTPYQIPATVRRNLVAFAIKQHQLEAFVIRQNQYLEDPIYNFNFPKHGGQLEHEDMAFLNKLSLERQARLAQAAVLHKKKFIRCACQHFRNEILVFCDHYQDDV